MTVKVVRGPKVDVRKVISKNFPTILTGLSVAGLISTTVLAVRATPKAMRLMELEREHNDDITKWETVKLLFPTYVPSVIMGTVTIGCMIGANTINLRRNAALASVYSIAEKTLSQYQDKVVETIGENKEKAIRDEIAKDTIQDNPPSEKDVIFTGAGDALCYDALSGRYFRGDIEKVRKSENVLNKMLIDGEFVRLNDVYYEIGLDPIKMGDEIGWTVESELIAFEFSSQLTTDGTPCLVIDFIVPPRYDYM